MDHGATDLDVAERATTLGTHGILALEGRVQQGLITGGDAGGPGGGVAELGSTGGAGGMAGRALGLEHLLARFHRRNVVHVLHLDGAHRLDASCHRLPLQRHAAG